MSPNANQSPFTSIQRSSCIYINFRRPCELVPLYRFCGAFRDSGQHRSVFFRDTPNCSSWGWVAHRRTIRKETLKTGNFRPSPHQPWQLEVAQMTQRSRKSANRHQMAPQPCRGPISGTATRKVTLRRPICHASLPAQCIITPANNWPCCRPDFSDHQRQFAAKACGLADPAAVQARCCPLVSGSPPRSACHNRRGAGSGRASFGSPSRERPGP